MRPAAAPIPAGFIADKGRTYAARTNARIYGWSAARMADAVRRNEFPLPQFDTFIPLKPGSTAATWDIALANGT